MEEPQPQFIGDQVPGDEDEAEAGLIDSILQQAVGSDARGAGIYPEEAPEDDNPFNEFSPRVQEDVDGLMWLGHIEETIEFCGHTFVLRTLKADEEIAAAAAVREYLFEGSPQAARAYAWAQVGLALVSIDGDQEFCPAIGPDRTAHALARFKYVTSRWYWATGEYLFSQYTLLLQRQVDAINAIQDLSARSLPTSPPLADFSTEQGTSSAPTSSETPL